jgi:broad specificity phosphatase PhoE
MSVTRLYLIRHGQSAGNAEGRFGGHSATPLSPLGQRQAKFTAQALARERIHAIYSSDLRRAMQTANALGKLAGLKVIPHPAFRERHVGVLEGLTFDEAEQHHPADYRALVDRSLLHCITNGESYAQLLERTDAALAEILKEHEGKKIAIFAHTGTICFITLKMLGAITPETVCTPWLVTANCGINRFEIRPGNNIRVLAINDTRHLSRPSGHDAFAAR